MLRPSNIHGICRLPEEQEEHVCPHGHTVTRRYQREALPLDLDDFNLDHDAVVEGNARCEQYDVEGLAV
jgi:hypothetical protein